MRRWMKRIAWALGGLLLLVGLALIGGRYWLASDGGRSMIAGLAADAGVRLEGLEGDPFGAMSVARIEVSDSDGVWLAVEDAAIDWRLSWSLLARKVSIESVTAERIVVARPPAAEADTAPEPSGPFEPPNLSLAIKRLAVGEIEIAEVIAGAKTRLGLNASAAYAQQAANIHLDIDRLDETGELTLIANYALATDAFDLDLTLRDPAGGLASALLGLTDGVEARLEGGGDLTGWKGRLTAQSGAAELAALDIGIERIGDAARLRVQGVASPGPLLPPDATAILGPDARIDLDATAPLQGGAIALTQLTLDAKPAALAASGRFDPESGAIEASIETRRIDAATLADLAPGLTLGAPRLRVDVSGTADAPKARAVLKATDVGMDGVAVDAPELVVDASTLAEPAGAIDWRAHLTAAAVALGDPAVDPIVAGRWQATASGVFDPAAAEIPIDVHATGANGMDARFGGRVSPSVDGLFAAELADLSILAPLAGVPLTGPGAVRSTVVFGESGLRLSDAKVEALGVAIAGRLGIDAEFSELDGAFTATAPDLRRAAAVVDAPLAGALAADIRLTGPVADPATSGELRLQPLLLDGQRFESARLRFGVSALASGPRGRADAQMASPYGALAAGAGFAMSGQTLKLSELSATAPGARATGAAVLNLQTAQADGEIVLKIASLADAARPFGVEAAGAGDARIRLRPDRRGQAIDARMSLAGVGAPGVAVQSLELDAKGGIDGGAPLKVDLSLKGVNADDAQIEQVRLTLDGPLTDAAVRLVANGEAADSPFDADLQGRLAVTDAGQRFRLNKGAGSFAKAPFAFAPGLEVANDDAGVRVTGLALDSAPLELEAAFAMGAQGIDLDLRRAALNLDGLSDISEESPLTGGIVAAGRIQGPLTAPAGRIQITGKDLRARDEPESPTAQLAGALDLQPTRLALDLSATGIGDAPLTLQGGVGLAPSADGPPTPGPSSPLELRLKWSGEIGPLVVLAPLDEHRLTGEAAIDMRVAGTVGAPDARGTVALTSGRYEHLDFGTALAFERIEIEANGNQVALKPFDARAGDGVISVSGNADLDGAKGYPFAVAVELRNALLAARDDVTANASGEVKLENDVDGMSVFARIQTERVDVELIDTSPASIAVLPVEEIGPTPPGRKDETPPDTTPGPPIALDVEVAIPGRFFVRGRGLESEWAGNIAVGGLASAPEVNGEINLKRGSFDVAGKRLQISEGVVRLEPDASGRLEAIVDVLAEYEGADFAAAIQVEGPANAPELTLSSTPELPRDEILARLLFNKHAGALTATESLQLAAAAASLASGGGGGGFDPVAMVRQATGIDALRVDVGEDGNPSVEAGKYLTDDVYVGVRQGAGPDAGAVTVEVEVFENITLDSEARQDGSQRIGGRLKWDY